MKILKNISFIILGIMVIASCDVLPNNPNYNNYPAIEGKVYVGNNYNQRVLELFVVNYSPTEFTYTSLQVEFLNTEGIIYKHEDRGSENDAYISLRQNVEFVYYFILKNFEWPNKIIITVYNKKAKLLQGETDIPDWDKINTVKEKSIELIIIQKM